MSTRGNLASAMKKGARIPTSPVSPTDDALSIRADRRKAILKSMDEEIARYSTLSE